LSLENLIDPMSAYIVRQRDADEPEDGAPIDVPRLKSKGYMDSYINPPEFIEAQKQKMAEAAEKKKKFPEEPHRDVLQFLIQHAPLSGWQRDVMEIIRREAYYFAPQAMTKIMNEGWATYWHSKLMTEGALSAAEIIDYADACSGILATGPGQLNPYKLGVELFRHIESRWDKGQFGKEWDECETLAEKRDWDRRLGQGRQKIFEVRKLYNDITFIDEFFTLDFCLEQKFYSFSFNDRTNNWEIMSRDFKKVKEQLLRMLTNRGQPFIQVEDANFENRSELLLKHRHEGTDLDLGQAQDTMGNVFKVWSRPVNLLTKVEGKGKILRFDEEGFSDKPAEFEGD
jgi:stage V sporulation protein R